MSFRTLRPPHATQHQIPGCTALEAGGCAPPRRSDHPTRRTPAETPQLFASGSCLITGDAICSCLTTTERRSRLAKLDLKIYYDHSHVRLWALRTLGPAAALSSARRDTAGGRLAAARAPAASAAGENRGCSRSLRAAREDDAGLIFSASRFPFAPQTWHVLHQLVGTAPRSTAATRKPLAQPPCRRRRGRRRPVSCCDAVAIDSSPASTRPQLITLAKSFASGSPGTTPSQPRPSTTRADLPELEASRWSSRSSAARPPQIHRAVSGAISAHSPLPLR